MMKLEVRSDEVRSSCRASILMGITSSLVLSRSDQNILLNLGNVLLAGCLRGRSL